MREAWRQAGLLSLLLGAGLLQLALPFFDAPSHSLILGVIFFHFGLLGLFASPPSLFEKNASTVGRARPDLLSTVQTLARPTDGAER